VADRNGRRGEGVSKIPFLMDVRSYCQVL